MYLLILRNSVQSCYRTFSYPHQLTICWWQHVEGKRRKYTWWPLRRAGANYHWLSNEFCLHYPQANLHCHLDHRSRLSLLAFFFLGFRIHKRSSLEDFLIAQEPLAMRGLGVKLLRGHHIAKAKARGSDLKPQLATISLFREVRRNLPILSSACQWNAMLRRQLHIWTVTIKVWCHQGWEALQKLIQVWSFRAETG